MRKGSAEAKAWGRKMKRLREGKKSTRKYKVRKTARRAYVGLKKRTRRSRCVTKCITRRYKKKSDNFSF
tara:strand:- start:952 stop:1158 length:207 start_codon:yes stop_codon:yes gene_type:complete